MAVSKAFSFEDGNLESVGAKYRRERPYKDIDLSFLPRPGALDQQGNRQPADIYKKNDAAAVKQAVRNLVMTQRNEKPFQPGFGAGLNTHLFEPNDEDTAVQIEQDIKEAIQAYEPRALVVSVEVNPRLESRINPQARDDNPFIVPDLTNTMDVTIIFQVVATQEQVSINTVLTRLR